MLMALRGLVPGTDKATTLSPGSDPLRVDGPVRIASNGRAIKLELGKQTLRLYPETGLASAHKNGHTAWLIADPERSTAELTGFIRLGHGRSALIGRGNDEYQAIFDFPKTVAKRHIAVENIDGQILIRPLDPDCATYVSAADEKDRVAELRLRNLRRVRKLFGGRIELLPPEDALDCLKEAHQALCAEPYRPRDAKDRPGGLLELPQDQAPIIVGDLHARVDNLLKVLSEGSYLHALRRGEAYLLFLGDVVHREAEDELEEMDSSLLMLDLIFKLKVRFPKNVFHLRGNHETFDEDVGKGGVPQGLLLRQRAKTLRGKKYAHLLADYFDALPYVAMTKDFIACHAGPPRFKVTRKSLIEIGARPDLARELIWNRVRRPNRFGGYTKKDVKAFRAALGAEKHTPLIVSHNCLAPEGTVWSDAVGIKGLHIVFSARPDQVALYIRGRRGMVPLVHATEELLDLINGLDPT